MAKRGPLVRLAKVDNGVLTVDPESASGTSVLAWSDLMGNAKVRRWDQVQIGDATLTEGAVPVAESGATDLNWLDLEDGVQVRFAEGGNYRAGDYWLIAARVATGKVGMATGRNGRAGVARAGRGAASFRAAGVRWPECRWNDHR